MKILFVFPSTHAQCICLVKEITYLVLFFWSYVFKVLFIGINFSLLLMGISNLRLRLKPKKWNMTHPCGLLVSSMMQTQPKSSVIVAIPSALTLMTQRTNQVGSFFFFFWVGGGGLGWLDCDFLSFIFKISMHCVFLTNTLLGLVIKVLFDYFMG